MISAIRFSATDKTESTVYPFVAFRTITKSRNTVADVSFPVEVVSDRPAHSWLLAHLIKPPERLEEG